MANSFDYTGITTKRYAVVQMDPVESNSNGGIVVAIKPAWPANTSDMIDPDTNEIMSVFELSNEFGTDHTFKLIPCGDDVEVNWIYTDKTNIFIDSNSSSN